MSVAAGRPWVVLKFGGTSVSSLGRWQRIADVGAYGRVMSSRYNLREPPAEITL